MKGLKKKLAAVELIVSDIDGVLTDGTVYLTGNGEESYRFSIQDGQGLRMALECGLQLAFVSGRQSQSAQRRLSDLGVRDIFQGIEEKGKILEQLLTKKRLDPEQVCAVGDDVADLALLERSGLPVAVNNAVTELKARAQWTTRNTGGNGALREIIEAILKAKGLWPGVMARFSRVSS